MAQTVQETATVLEEEARTVTLVAPKTSPRKYKYIYTNFLTFSYAHLAALYGLYLCFTSAKWETLLFSFVLFHMSNIGITAGAHRLWTHKTFKAKLPLEIVLMIFNSLAFQNTAITWAREHRLHHKYSDTDADPHNASRGFFYSHVGWLLVKKHPDVLKYGKTIDMSDVYNNPVLKFQKKYAVPLIGTVCFALPTLIPVYCWGESWNNAWHIALFRYIFNLNVTFLVNSAAHIWGNKPYDKSILPAQNLLVSFLASGEGFHNYHHVFPWDYRTAELGNNFLNLTTLFIDFCAWFGWAYDLKSVSEDIIKQRAERTGDGSSGVIWGWDDKDMDRDIKSKANIFYAKKE
ncbi:acyl-CoA Delta(11) desaturase [Trichoplusia ni]|uniref:Acyl-CoA Delta(11) desaturase n=1 Tax=Trichoplusia ni TaxID=7111 RepID=A0A7E5W0Q3_TRINI|nr:acyl-CoA Delta(11) desaturase [Trichoplusia ni]